MALMIAMIFRYLGNNGVLLCIKVRKNFRIEWKKGKDILRILAVMTQKKDFQNWKDSVSFTKIDCRNGFLLLKAKVWRVRILG